MADKARARCYDCAFFKDDAAFAQCWHDKLVVWDPVFGNQPARARNEREQQGVCGQDGKLFEERQPGAFEKALNAFANALVDQVRKVTA